MTNGYGHLRRSAKKAKQGVVNGGKNGKDAAKKRKQVESAARQRRS